MLYIVTGRPTYGGCTLRYTQKVRSTGTRIDPLCGGPISDKSQVNC